ncbi:MAG: chromate transporter [Lachnospiraceae bacterium]|nr:chromate transporter [Lachnospiraceae bacterium]
MIFLSLFLSFFHIGALSFGGGYAAILLIQEQVVDKHQWLTQSAFTDLISIAEMTPGSIALNAATFVGNQMAGLPGAIVATLGCILPSCIFVSLLAWIYTRCRRLSLIQGVLAVLRAIAVALIAKAGVTIMTTAFFSNGTWDFSAGNFQIRMLVFFAVALLLLRKTKLSPILIMTMCGVAEVSAELLSRL